jgi:hypothetical protein
MTFQGASRGRAEKLNIPSYRIPVNEYLDMTRDYVLNVNDGKAVYCVSFLLPHKEIHRRYSRRTAITAVFGRNLAARLSKVSAGSKHAEVSAEAAVQRRSTR